MRVAVLIDDKRDDRPMSDQSFWIGRTFFRRGSGKEYFGVGLYRISLTMNALSRASIPFCRVALRNARFTSVSTRRASIVTMSARKGGVASDEEFDAFMAKNAGKTVLVVDARNPDFTIEPDDEKFGGDAGTAPISDCGTAKRPNALNIPFDRATGSLPADGVELLNAKAGGDKGVPIVTHCGGGGRGQKAKDYLIGLGYTNVVNGGGPKVTELWERFGSL